jgi:hypothetical protein
MISKYNFLNSVGENAYSGTLLNLHQYTFFFVSTGTRSYMCQHKGEDHHGTMVHKYGSATFLYTHYNRLVLAAHITKYQKLVFAQLYSTAATHNQFFACFNMLLTCTSRGCPSTFRWSSGGGQTKF